MAAVGGEGVSWGGDRTGVKERENVKKEKGGLSESGTPPFTHLGELF